MRTAVLMFVTKPLPEWWGVDVLLDDLEGEGLVGPELEKAILDVTVKEDILEVLQEGRWTVKIGEANELERQVQTLLGGAHDA